MFSAAYECNMQMLSEGAQYSAGHSEGALLYQQGYPLYHGIVLVFLRIEAPFMFMPKKRPNVCQNPARKLPKKCLYYTIGGLVGLPIDQFKQHLP